MTGKHADPLEVAQERIAELEASVDTIWTELSWRATRYAMERKWTQHDAVEEALFAVLEEFKPPNFKLQPCTCAAKYGDGDR